MHVCNDPGAHGGRRGDSAVVRKSWAARPHRASFSTACCFFGGRGFFLTAPAVYCSGRFAFSLGVAIMALTIEAVYENGVLKPAQPLPLKEHERVQVTVQVKPSVARESAGLLRWRGDWETLRRLAEDDEFGILESP